VPIRNKVTRAYLLAGNVELKTSVNDDGVMLLGLPEKAPDAIDTVIVLEIEGAADVIEQRIKQAADGTLTILAIDADIQGHRAKIEKKGANPWNIGYWTDAKDIAVWQATIDRPGKFSVDLEYSLAPNSKGSEIAIEFGGKKIAVQLDAGKDFLDFKTVTVGEIELPAGPVTVTVRPVKKPGLAVMDLRQIVLKPR
jgi:hypothetical protein